MSNGIDPASIPIPPGVRAESLNIINQATQRRVEGKPVGYGILQLNPIEQQFYEEYSSAAVRLGQYDKGQAALRFERQQFRDNPNAVASGERGVIVRGPTPTEQYYRSSIIPQLRDVSPSQVQQQLAKSNQGSTEPQFINIANAPKDNGIYPTGVISDNNSSGNIRISSNISRTNLPSIRSKSVYEKEQVNRNQTYKNKYVESFKQQISYPFESVPNFAKTVGGLVAFSALTAVNPPAGLLTFGAIEGNLLSKAIVEKDPEAAAQVTIDAALLGVSKGVSKFTEPVVIKGPKPTAEYFTAGDKLVQTISGEKPGPSFAQFNIVGYTKPRFGLETTRGEVLASRLRDIVISPESQRAKNALNPEGKIVIVEPERLTVTSSDILKINKGEIQGPAGTITRIVNKDGIQKEIVSTIEGITRPDAKTIKTMEDIKSQDRIEASNIKAIQKEFPDLTITKGNQIESAAVTTKDILVKYGEQKGYRLVPLGRRTSRAEINAISKDIINAEFETPETTAGGGRIIERGKTAQVLAIRDISLPTNKARPKILKAEVERALIEYPDVSNPLEYKFQKGTKKPINDNVKQQLQEQTKQELQILNQARAAGFLSAKKAQGRIRPALPETRVTTELNVKQLPLIVGGQGKGTSEFYGQGNYERTVGGLLPLSNNSNREISNEVNSEINRVIPREIQRPVAREIARDVSKDIAKELPREITREQQREVQRSITREVTRDLARSVDKGALSNYNIGDNYPRARGSRKQKRSTGFGRFNKAYSVLIKKRGKYQSARTNLPRGLALLTLSNILRTDLARTGKIIESGETDIPDISFRPSEQIFRQYRIKKGNKINLDVNEFIQRTRANLQTREEKLLIQEARRKI